MGIASRKRSCPLRGGGFISSRDCGQTRSKGGCPESCEFNRAELLRDRRTTIEADVERYRPSFLRVLDHREHYGPGYGTLHIRLGEAALRDPFLVDADVLGAMNMAIDALAGRALIPEFLNRPANLARDIHGWAQALQALPYALSLVDSRRLVETLYYEVQTYRLTELGETAAVHRLRQDQLRARQETRQYEAAASGVSADSAPEQPAPEASALISLSSGPKPEGKRVDLWTGDH